MGLLQNYFLLAVNIEHWIRKARKPRQLIDQENSINEKHKFQMNQPISLGQRAQP